MRSNGSMYANRVSVTSTVPFLNSTTSPGNTAMSLGLGDSQSIKALALAGLLFTGVSTADCSRALLRADIFFRNISDDNCSCMAYLIQQYICVGGRFCQTIGVLSTELK